MKISTLVIVLSLPLAAGCSSVRQVEMDRVDTWMPAAQRDLLAEDVTVTMADGSAARGTIIKLNADSLCLQGEDGAPPRIEPLARVSMIRQSRNVAPVIGGLLGGVLLGGIVGAAIAAENEEPDPAALGMNTGFAAIGGAAVGALVGGVVVGVGVGIATSVTDYRITPGQAPARPKGAATALPDSVQQAR